MYNGAAFMVTGSPETARVSRGEEVNMAEYDFSQAPNLASYYREPSVHGKMPTLPPTRIQNATLAAYYRRPKVNWKVPTLPPLSIGGVKASR